MLIRFEYRITDLSWGLEGREVQKNMLGAGHWYCPHMSKSSHLTPCLDKTEQLRACWALRSAQGWTQVEVLYVGHQASERKVQGFQQPHLHRCQVSLLSRERHTERASS